MPHLIILFCLWVGAIFAEGMSPSNNTKQAYRYRSTAHGFLINLPTGWEVDEKRKGMALMVTRPSSGPGDLFRENFSVHLESVSAVPSLNEFLKQSVSGLRIKLTAFYLQEQGILKLGRGVGAWLVYGYELDKRPIKVLQTFILMPDKVFTLTGAALPARFSKYREIFRVMAESFSSH